MAFPRIQQARERLPKEIEVEMRAAAPTPVRVPTVLNKETQGSVRAADSQSAGSLPDEYPVDYVVQSHDHHVEHGRVNIAPEELVDALFFFGIIGKQICQDRFRMIKSTKVV